MNHFQIRLWSPGRWPLDTRLCTLNTLHGPERCHRTGDADALGFDPDRLAADGRDWVAPLCRQGDEPGGCVVLIATVRIALCIDEAKRHPRRGADDEDTLFRIFP